MRTQVDVLNAQQLLFSARRDLAQSKYTYVLSLLRLEAAIGELTEDDLGGGESVARPDAADGRRAPPNGAEPVCPREAAPLRADAEHAR